MAKYHMGDVQTIQEHSDLTYEEAVHLLEYHDGSLARALLDLERNGKIRDKKNESHRTKAKSILEAMYRFRIKLQNKQVTISNVSILTLLILLIFAPHVVIIGSLVALVLGYSFSIQRNSADFSDDGFDAIWQKVKNNVSKTVHTVSKQFEGDKKEKAYQGAPSNKRPVKAQVSSDQKVEIHQEDDGFSEANIK